MPPTPPTGRGEHTRNALLQAAADLFVANGYHGTSMRGIAGRAGIALGGIYNHFDSKEALFAAVIRERHPINQLLPLLAEAEGRTVEELFRDGAQRVVTAMESDQGLLRLMFVELVEFDGRHIMELFDDLFPTTLAFTLKLVQAPGGLKPLPPLAILRGFFGLIFSHAVLRMVLAGTPLDAGEGALDELMNIFLYGVLDETPETVALSRNVEKTA